MKWKNIILSLAMVFIMVGVSDLFQSPAIVFPEVAALTIGGWIMARQPWRVSRWMLVFLMTLSAVVGICLARLSWPVVIKIGLAFLFAALTLTLTRTSITPIFSACILPVLLEETGWVYVVSVALMSIILTVVRYFIEQARWVRPYRHRPATLSGIDAFGRYIRLFLALLLFSFIAILLDAPFLLAPPLVVTFVECYDPQSRWRKAPFGIWCLLTIGALFGVLCRFLLTIRLGLPLALSAVAAFLLLLLVFRVFRQYFPPAGALAILPMIIPMEALSWLFILQVAIGAAVFIVASIFLSKTQYRGGLSWDDLEED